MSARRRGALSDITPTPIAPQNGSYAATGALAHLSVTGLPLPPSLNHAYKNLPGRGRAITVEAKSYKAQAGLLIRNAAVLQGFAIPPKRWLAVWLLFVFPINNRDGSNAVKLIEDAAAEALGFDDRWVATMTWQKLVNRDEPRCEMRIEVLP